MVTLSDLVSVLNIQERTYPAVFIINKPYKDEHILFRNLDQYSGYLSKILSALGDAPVVRIDLEATITDTRGSYSGTKIYIKEPNAIFDLGNDRRYGTGLIDFGDIESGTYDWAQFYTYKDMGFYRPKKKLAFPDQPDPMWQ